MARVSLYNQEGKHIGEHELADAHFAVKPDAALVHEAIVAYQKFDPDFQPARNISRRLLGLQDISYQQKEL